MKKAELVLKGYVSESSSTQLTSLNIAINGGLAMGHYWKGRLLLEQAKQDHDRCNDYENAAIVSFCATNVTERFDHLPENANEDAVPQLSPPQWLSAIELLRYPDRKVFVLIVEWYFKRFIKSSLSKLQRCRATEFRYITSATA